LAGRHDGAGERKHGWVDPGNGDSFLPIISANGRYVLFHSKASNLAAGSSGGGTENLFFRDLQTGTTYALTSALGGVGMYSAASMTLTANPSHLSARQRKRPGHYSSGIHNRML